MLIRKVNNFTHYFNFYLRFDKNWIKVMYKAALYFVTSIADILKMKVSNFA